MNEAINRYQIPDQEARKLAQQVLEELETAGFHADPIHFTLFYEWLGRLDPSMAEEIDTALTTKTYDEHTAHQLFRHLWAQMISDSLESKQFTEAINTLVHFIESWMQESKVQADTLTHKVQGLSLDTPPETLLAQLKEDILPTLQNYQQNSELLHERIQQSSQEMKALRKKLAEATTIAKTDELTNLPNRRGFRETVQQVMDKAVETERSFAMLILDIDHFKQINDEYGHLIGDAILRYLAKLLHNQTKGQDHVARIGGEEFVILLPDTQYSGALSVAETIRKQVAARSLQMRKNHRPIQLTLSIGVAMFQLSEPFDALFDRADQSLYLAKNSGRNRVKGETDL
ncbi:GGDEF domain-containing protein [Thiomicrospira sp. WB1]|uniref:GGDEF domain-containing protein n=1 Tax=Thiomicrospira sp. WB1 TaxID=1685380 RepID=UPI00074A82F6|nr:GGDEF domain-containing protein [Thiomicrospira sp. WB1]KUJ71466.1 diguanylate cyclase [Thiomicrospira sp. WB1]